MAMRESRKKRKLCAQEKGKADKELLMAPCKEVKKVKHQHKPLYLLLASSVSSMNFNKGVQVDQEKNKRQLWIFQFLNI